MAENLDQFFDPKQGHTKSATFKTSVGATIRTVDVIFTGATGNVPVLEGVHFEAPQPFLQCRSADLASVDHTCKVTIGATTYRIVNDLHDGNGISMIFLQP